jgi:hypothetical protein
LISPRWNIKFHVHTYASNLAIRPMLTSSWTSLENVTNQLPMYHDYSTMLNEIIQQLKGRHLQWCMFSINYVITCWVTNSSFMWIIWHCYTWSRFVICNLFL